MTEQGRLIDRYELMREIEKYFNPYDDWKTQIIADRIIHAPTIEERKKGKWIRETKHYKDDEQEYYYYEEHCSCCGVKRRIGWGYARFCPNCGAELI